MHFLKAKIHSLPVDKSSLTSWRGVLKNETERENVIYDKKPIHLNQDNLILKGSFLRNTKFIVGIVMRESHENQISKDESML